MANQRVAIQGGGMRIAYALGATSALVANGVPIRSFSCSSAGTVAALGVYSRSIEDFTGELLERLAGRRFINPWRVHRIADMEYLVDVVIGLVDLNGLATGPDIWASIVDSRDAILHHVRLTPDNARALLLATMAIPILYGHASPLGDSTYFDGGIGDTLPLPHAATLAASGEQLLAVATRPTGRLRRHRNGLGERIGILLDPRVSRTMRHLILAPNPLVASTLEMIERGSVGGCAVRLCEPSDDQLNFSRTNTSVMELEALRVLGRRDMQALLASSLGST